jgi:hypothetical protein
MADGSKANEVDHPCDGSGGGKPSNKAAPTKKAVVKKPLEKKTAAPTASASVGDSDVRRFECPSSSGGKFWEISLDGPETTVKYGAIGSGGVTQVKDHGRFGF